MIFAIIGSGNVATHLSLALSQNGHSILQVYNRNFNNAQSLANKVAATAIKSLAEINPIVAAIILAVSDDAVSEVLDGLVESRGSWGHEPRPRELKGSWGHEPRPRHEPRLEELEPRLEGHEPIELSSPKPIIIHTSGTLPITVLSATATQYGVLYPLQTLSKNVEINFLNVPLCIEANNVETEQTLLNVANSISNLVYKINSEQRKTLHIAAVFACNFTNYFYAIADDLLQQNHLSFDMLKPLITETAHKILTNSPQQVQTGPAKRNDKSTMNNHLSALSQHPNYQLLYKLISEGIVTKYRKY